MSNHDYVSEGVWSEDVCGLYQTIEYLPVCVAMSARDPRSGAARGESDSAPQATRLQTGGWNYTKKQETSLKSLDVGVERRQSCSNTRFSKPAFTGPGLVKPWRSSWVDLVGS